jgi:hypothetical protein
MRSISAMAASTSLWAASRESWSLAPVLADCTARSRTRWSSEWTSPSAPSAVCTRLIPSWALRWATLNPPTFERRFSLMDSPAASSAARLIRYPEDSFSRDLDICVSVEVRLR